MACRDKQFKNRFGRQGGCRSTGAARRAAEQQFRREFWMTPRAMRRYWDEQQAALYGPCNLASRWLAWRGVKALRT